MLKSPQGDIIPQAVSCEFNATNNEEEYEALIMGLQLARDLHIKDIVTPPDQDMAETSEGWVTSYKYHNTSTVEYNKH